ncbi:MAG: MarR family winged helix-turn-helix transcriptional regulator [Planctomycetota bacterium JB042]
MEDPTNLPLEDRIVAALRRIMRAVDLHSRRLAESCGLTGPQLATMLALKRLGPSSATTLARAVHLGNATMSGIVSRLVKRQFVVRDRGEVDRRTVVVDLTPLGHEILAHAPSLLQDRFRSRLMELDEWERQMALAMLTRIAGMMDAEHLDAAPHLVTDDEALSGASGATAAPEPEPRPRGTKDERPRRMRRRKVTDDR